MNNTLLIIGLNQGKQNIFLKLFFNNFFIIYFSIYALYNKK